MGKRRKSKFIWMTCTADEFEHPILICDSIYELSEATGVSVGSIKCEISRCKSGKRRGYVFRKVYGG